MQRRRTLVSAAQSDPPAALAVGDDVLPMGRATIRAVRHRLRPHLFPPLSLTEGRAKTLVLAAAKARFNPAKLRAHFAE